MHPALEAIHDYYTAFSTLDLDAIVPHFCEPCMSLGPRGVYAAATRAELAKAFAAVIEGLRAKDYRRSRFVEGEVVTLSDVAVLVKGVAVRYATADSEIERLQISYLMHCGEGGWKIAAMVMPV